MARELKEEEWATSFCGVSDQAILCVVSRGLINRGPSFQTLTHMAPEMLVEGQTPLYDERVDLWALGCILYQLCSLE